MFETETVGPCLVRKLKWRDHGPPGPPSGYAPILIDLFKSLGNVKSMHHWNLKNEKSVYFILSQKRKNLLETIMSLVRYKYSFDQNRYFIVPQNAMLYVETKQMFG